MKKFKPAAALILAAGVMAASSLWADAPPNASQTPVAVWGNSARTMTHSKKISGTKKSKAVKPVAKAAVEKDTWICPMCHIKADKPGKCPECGMAMVKLPKDQSKK